jgi:hypothetical protein
MESFAVLVEQAGMRLAAGELADLKPLYDHYAAQIATLHELDLGTEDMAVAYSPVSGTSDPAPR